MFLFVSETLCVSKFMYRGCRYSESHIEQCMVNKGSVSYQSIVYIHTFNLSPLYKLSSAKFLVCFNFQGSFMSLKVGEHFVRVSNSLDHDETPRYLASHPDPSCLHMAL